MSLRTFTASLALAALLLGNVAGWVHVGEHAHHSCGGHARHEGLVQDSTVNPLATVEQSRRGSCCCDHHHCESKSLAKKTATESVADSAERYLLGATSHSHDAPPCQHDHDSQQCSVCQAIFACRDGFVTLSPDVRWEVLRAATSVIAESHVCLQTFEPGCFFVRGPPCV